MDDQARFYFMEANTRLQVEHPVTEFVTGIDIVKEQIRIAAGERLSFRQGEITFNGHAIECRVNAEDPETFVPSPGHISVFSLGGGPGIRVDTAAHSDCTIPPYYDSMIAKVISYGRDRHEAIVRMKRALEMSVVEGVKTTIPMHLRILNDPDFLAGRLSTKFMERFAPEQTKTRTAPRLSEPLSSQRHHRRRGDSPVGMDAAGARRRVSCGRRPLHTNSKQACGERRVSRHRARMSSTRAHKAGAMVIVNDRADIAKLSAADGVHVGQDDLDPASARRILGGAAIVGISTHSPDQVRAASRMAVDYIAVGPIFGTSTKDTGYRAVGTAFVSEAAAILRAAGFRDADRGDRRDYPRAGARRDPARARQRWRSFPICCRPGTRKRA